MEKLNKLSEYLYKTDYEKPFGFGYKTNAYVVLHPEGNILIYNYSNFIKYSDHIESLGGIRYHYLSHHHEYGKNILKLNEKFNFHTSISAIDIEYISNPGQFNKFSIDNKTEELHKNFFSMHMPGHTPGSCIFMYKKNNDILLFTGDTLFIGEKNSLDITKIYSLDINTLKKSIKELKDAVLPTLVLPSGSLGDDQYMLIQNNEDWVGQIEKILNE